MLLMAAFRSAAEGVVHGLVGGVFVCGPLCPLVEALLFQAFGGHLLVAPAALVLGAHECLPAGRRVGGHMSLSHTCTNGRCRSACLLLTLEASQLSSP